MVQRRGVGISWIAAGCGSARIAAGRGSARIRQDRSRSLHRLRRRGAPGTARNVGRDGLTGYPLMLLRQPPDEGVRGCKADRAVEWIEVAGEDPQQRALAFAIDTDHSDDVAGRHGQIQALEEGAVGEPTGHILRDERCGHRPIVAPSAEPANPVSGP